MSFFGYPHHIIKSKVFCYDLRFRHGFDRDVYIVRFVEAMQGISKLLCLAHEQMDLSDWLMKAHTELDKGVDR